MLALTAPGVNSFNGYMYRKLELDTKIFKRSNDILAKMLQSGNHLTRSELNASFLKAKIKADGLASELYYDVC